MRVWGVSPQHQAILSFSVDTSYCFTMGLCSDPTYLDMAPDPTGSGLSPTGAPPFRGQPQVVLCASDWLRKTQVPMPLPQVRSFLRRAQRTQKMLSYVYQFIIKYVIQVADGLPEEVRRARPVGALAQELTSRAGVRLPSPTQKLMESCFSRVLIEPPSPQLPNSPEGHEWG